MTVVISQPMYFPWVGMCEQMRLADTFVYYDDVAFSKGSFSNRVQVKTHQGTAWLTLPLKQQKAGQTIEETLIDNRQNWKKKHLSTLEQSYAKAPHVSEMLSLVREVFEYSSESLAEISIISMQVVNRYFGFEYPKKEERASRLNIPGSGSERVLAVVKAMRGDVYVTGHGAKNYLNHQLFDNAGIDVKYMSYLRVSYPQLHGIFTPYVTALDLVANCGRAGEQYIRSSAVPWKQFLS